MAPYAQSPANRFAQSVHYTKPAEGSEPLRYHVERMVREYFSALGDELPTDLYELILKEVELPLLKVVLEKTRGNQTKCAQVLGLNRGTLRKKLKCYDLM
ncbi:DNA-binding transcriptional regulator Fis [Psychrobacter sp. AH5]|uniref:DNA-binding transcriptional regulator Fis n=1 Tax=Psychrobacter sp. AH5 TaxID=2937433 RepID=UPI0033428530